MPLAASKEERWLFFLLACVVEAGLMAGACLGIEYYARSSLSSSTFAYALLDPGEVKSIVPEFFAAICAPVAISIFGLCVSCTTTKISTVLFFLLACAIEAGLMAGACFGIEYYARSSSTFAYALLDPGVVESIGPEVFSAFCALVAISIFGLCVSCTITKIPTVLWIYVSWVLLLLGYFLYCPAVRDLPSEERDLRRSLKVSLMRYRIDSDASVQPEAERAWDWLQSVWKCCGVDGYEEWGQNTYLRMANKIVPDSCSGIGDLAALPGCYDFVKDDLLESRHLIAVAQATFLRIFVVQAAFGLVMAVWAARVMLSGAA